MKHLTLGLSTRAALLLAALGHGLTATSANRGGEPPIVDPAALADLLAGEDAMVVDGGVLPGGPPSTLVAIEGDRVVVLRSGRFPAERFEEDLRSTEEEG
jgi:tRNA A37 threonylcarbamoyladenosine synthetase subunit TsaC/SUA5/YrdC